MLEAGTTELESARVLRCAQSFAKKRDHTCAQDMCKYVVAGTR